VVLGSGDHIFVPMVLELLARSVPVEVVARPEGTSARLRLTGISVHPFRSELSVSRIA
jgi:hypothetical protein